MKTNKKVQRSSSSRLLNKAILNAVGSVTIVCLALGISALVPVFSATAIETKKAEFDIPAQDAPEALRTFAEQAGLKILFPQNQIQGTMLKSVSGYLETREALYMLLEGADISFRFRENGTITVFPSKEKKPRGDQRSGISSRNGEYKMVQAGAVTFTPVANNDTPDSVALDEVIVTAQRRESLLRLTPIAITNLDSNTLLKQGIDNILDMDYMVPGLKIGQQFSSAKITIRGIGNENVFLGGDPGVAVHVDDVYVARTEAVLSSFFDVERIEVLRGPQGTLYGRNSTGGTINIINKAPTEEFDGQIFVEGGSFDQWGLGGFLSGPILQDDILGRISFRIRENDGYVENIVPGQDDLNNQKFYSIRGQLEVKPTENLNINIKADYHEDDDNGPANVALGTLTGPSVPELFFGGIAPAGDFTSASNIDSSHKTELSGVSVTVNWDLGFAELTSITAYRDSEIDIFYDADGTDADFQTVRTIDKSKQFSQELRFASSNNETLDWILGAYYFNDDSSQDVTTSVAGVIVSPDPLLLAPLFVNIGGDLETSSYAFFGNGTWKPFEKLHLNAGIRYTHDKKELSEFSTIELLAPPMTFTAKGEESWGEITYRVGAQYFPFEKTMLFASLSSGYKSGGFNAGALTPAFDPEKAMNVELGLKTRLFSDRADLNITLFHMDYDDLQVAQVIGFAVIVQNAAKATLQGIEAEAAFAITDAFNLRTSLSYLDATFDEFSDIDISNPLAGLQDLEGRHLPNSPELTFAIVPEYTFDIRDYGELSLYGAYSWQDRVYFDPFNNEKFSQESVGRVDAGATFTTKDGAVRVIAYGKNLSDEPVINNVFKASAVVLGAGLANFSPARSYGFRLEFNF